MTRTIYTVKDERGIVETTTNTEQASKPSRAGLTVYAETKA